MRLKVGVWQVLFGLSAMVNLWLARDLFIGKKEIAEKEVTILPTAVLTPTPTDLLPPWKEIAPEMSRLLGNIFGGKVEYNLSYSGGEGKDVFQNEEYDFVRNGGRGTRNGESKLGASIGIRAIKYVPGLVFSNAYEGSEWEVSLDKWKRWLTGLKVGKNMTKVYDDWMLSGEEDDVIQNKKLGERLFAIYDRGFKPSESVVRRFVTFDGRNKQIVTISVWMDQEERAGRCSSGETLYSIGAANLFGEVEGMLSKIE